MKRRTGAFEVPKFSPSLVASKSQEIIDANLYHGNKGLESGEFNLNFTFNSRSDEGKKQG